MTRSDPTWRQRRQGGDGVATAGLKGRGGRVADASLPEVFGGRGETRRGQTRSAFRTKSDPIASADGSESRPYPGGFPGLRGNVRTQTLPGWI